MTNEVAIKAIQDFIGWFKEDSLIRKALEMAIQALSQEPCDECKYKTFTELYFHTDSEMVEHNPCETCGYAEGSPFCLQYCPYDAERKKEQEPCDDKRLFIKIYADYEPSVVAEKVYQICDEDEFPEVVSQLNAYLEPCDDAISRKAVLNLIEKGECLSNGAVMKLPSVTQKSETVTEFADRCRECGAKYGKLLEQKSGKWIDYRDDGFVECPFCGHATNCEDDIDELHYCFYCGAKMVEPQESEV